MFPPAETHVKRRAFPDIGLPLLYRKQDDIAWFSSDGHIQLCGSRLGVRGQAELGHDDSDHTGNASGQYRVYACAGNPDLDDVGQQCRPGGWKGEAVDVVLRVGTEACAVD